MNSFKTQKENSMFYLQFETDEEKNFQAMQELARSFIYKPMASAIPEDSNKSFNKLAKHKEISQGISELYRCKNHDYGDSFGKSFQEWGSTMLAIRLDDKLNRFKQLIRNPGTQIVTDESVIDTLRDLANYAIMGLVEFAFQESANDRE